jgi:hypothetical protein
MKKNIYFDIFDGPGWPEPQRLKRYFFAPKGKEWSYRGGNDSWGLGAEGLEGTENLDRADQVNVQLYMTGNPNLGVNLLYSKWDGRIRRRVSFSSKGDLNRLHEFARSRHGTPLSVGLFIPFREAWKAVKEFIESDGQLPKGIEWINNDDLSPNIFPDP